jgi:CheY-like chemotaxis protein/HPt (histidine-containing phosphotransfer) domain-containing protein
MLLAEYGEKISNQNVTILTTPIFSLPVANFLNGVYIAPEKDTFTTTRVAPDAKILSVDDINTNLIVLEGFLKPYKMQVTSHKTGQDAIEALKSASYDLVFLDYMMPGMDGIETLQHIKELVSDFPHLKNIPVIALSANAIIGTRRMFLDKGFDDFLPKPIDTEALHDILNKWMPNKKWMEIEIGTDNNKEESNLNVEININGLNVNRGLSMTGSAENYLKVLEVFYKDGMEKVQEIKACLKNNDLPLYVIYVHAIKSASSNIGAEHISETARTLEEAGNRGDLEFISVHNKQLISDLEILLGEIGALLTKTNPKELPASADMDLFKTVLYELKDAILKFDSASIKKASDILHKQAKGTDIEATVENISKSILNGDDDTTISLIDSLLCSAGAIDNP